MGRCLARQQRENPIGELSLTRRAFALRHPCERTGHELLDVCSQHTRCFGRVKRLARDAEVTVLGELFELGVEPGRDQPLIQAWSEIT